MSASLAPTWVIGSVDLTYEPFMVDRDNTVDIGEPETVIESLPSMLADGDNERITRYGNRVYKIVFYIEGPTLADVAESEAVLRRELRRPGLELTHNPGDGWSVDSVYEVRTAVLTPGRRDDHEAHFLRQFTLTLTCAPFARSASPVTVEALEVGSAAVTFDDGSSATGWTGSVDGTPMTVAAGFWDPSSVGIGELTSAIESPQTWTMTRAGSVNFTGTPFLVAKVRLTDQSQNLRAFADGVELPLLSQRYMGGAVGEFVFQTAGGTVSSLRFEHRSSPGVIWQVLIVWDLSRTGVPPGETSRQKTRILEIEGTERTPASVHVASQDGTTNLGMTIVHTSPEDGSGYSPPLRRWRVSGGTVTTDSTTMSGGREPMLTAVTPFIAEVPNSAVPEGGYLLAARLRRSSAGTVAVNWAAETVIDGTSDGYATDYATVTFPNTGWFFMPVAAITLPTIRSHAGKVRVSMSAPAGVEIDEGWLFRVDDDCALTVVHNVVKPNMWLDSPDVMSSVPRIWIGNDAGRANASHPGANLFTHGNHTFTPERVQVFAATAGTENPAVDLTYYPRWPNNAAS